MYEIDRMAAIIRPTQLFVEWINQTCVIESEQVKLQELQNDCTILLLPVFESSIEAEDYIASIYQDIFEKELEAWCLDDERWPRERTPELFNQWFHLELHSFVYDTLIDESYEESEPEITTMQ